MSGVCVRVSFGVRSLIAGTPELQASKSLGTGWGDVTWAVPRELLSVLVVLVAACSTQKSDNWLAGQQAKVTYLGHGAGLYRRLQHLGDEVLHVE